MSERARGPKAVVDANVLVRFVLTPRGFSARLRRAIERRRFALVTSKAILAEVADVLGRPHVQRHRPYAPELVRKAVAALRRLAIVVPGRYEVYAVADDPKDNPILAAALEADADFVVTDDRKHLLPLKHYHRVQIVSVPDFLRHHLQKR